MSGFRTHLTGGFCCGAAGALIGWTGGVFTAEDCVAACSMGTLGGLLPDLDADKGRPLRFLFEILSILVPVVALFWAHRWLMGKPSLFVSFVVLGYLIVRYGMFTVVQTMTKHRGNLHSIPFALICGEICWLLFAGVNPGRPEFGNIPFLMGVVTTAGALGHLVLDEVSSVGLRWGVLPRLKASSGTALKLVGVNTVGTALLYMTAVTFGLLLWWLAR